MLTFLGDVALLEEIGAGSYKPDTPYIFNLEYVIDNGSLSPTPGKINLKSKDHDFERHFGKKPYAVNLANNHIFDYAREGFDAGCQILREEGIDYIGENALIKDDVFFVSYMMFKKPTPGDDVLGFSEQRFLDAVSKAREKNCKRIIVFMHWGIEHSPEASQNQKKIGRWLCDNGADIVVGAHPHCTQPIEEYNGKYICYSLGNALFTNHTGGSYFDNNGKPFYTRTTRWIKASKKSFAVVYDENEGKIVRVDKLLQTKKGLFKKASVSALDCKKTPKFASLIFRIRKYKIFLKSNLFVQGKLFNMAALRHEFALKKQKGSAK